MLQAKLEGLIRLPIALEAYPAEPVRLIWGKKAARAASTLAWEAKRLASASAMLGLRSSSSEGSARPQRRRHDAVQILRLDVEAFRSAAQQNGQRVARFALLFHQAGQARFLGGDH